MRQCASSRSPACGRTRGLRCLASAFAWLITIAASWLSGPVAYAGNDDGVLVGGQAALTGGAVTATTSDGTAAWYNPAGLAQLQRPSLDLNASVYGFNSTLCWVCYSCRGTPPRVTPRSASDC